MELIVSRAQDLAPDLDGSFDLVVCNPPYFQNSLKSDDRLRMVARHTTDLSVAEVFESMRRMMSRGAEAWLSYPDDSKDYWCDVGRATGLFLSHEISLRDYPQAPPHVSIS